MCPGIAVAAGGGGGGGAGGKGSKKGKGKKGAGKKKGKKGAKGGKKNGKKCGKGKAGKCGKCNSGKGKGDPIDVGTGSVYTIPETDVFFPGPLPLNILRQYNTANARRDVGLGFGWVFSLGWRITVHGKRVEILNDAGEVIETELPQEGGEALCEGGLVLRREKWGFALDEDGELWHIFSATPDGKEYLLTAIDDANHNRIELTYDDGRLVEIKDSGGRTIRVGHDRFGRIRVFSIKTAEGGHWVDLVEYKYSDAGDLVGVVDGAGYEHSFVYDEQHFLLSHTPPSGPTTHYRYDSQQRCTETWTCFPNGTIPGLSPDVPKFLDDSTPARGALHCKITYGDDGYSEAVDSVSVQRFFSNEDGLVEKSVSADLTSTRTFDNNGNLASIENTPGASFAFEYDQRGRLVREIEPTGNVIATTRDASGRVTEVADSMGTIVTVVRDTRGNVVAETLGMGEITTYRYDTRGLVLEQIHPNGGHTGFDWDQYGNLVAIRRPDGTTTRYTYDYWGRPMSMVEANGAVTRYTFDERFLLIALHRPDGGIWRYSYNAQEDLVHAIDPDGYTTTFHYNGMHSVVGVTYATGATVSYLYDREENLVAVINENGEIRRLSHNANGDVVQISSFDGRVQRYRYDAEGSLVRYEDGNGHITDYVRDVMGQVAEVTHSDGSGAAFHYDLRGQLVRANGSSNGLPWEIRWDRNKAGVLTRETQTVDGASHSVDYDLDPHRDVVGLRSSLGHVRTVGRDAFGRVTDVVLDGTRVEFRRDEVGQETQRLFGRSRIDTAYDPVGNIVRRRVITATAAPRAKEPEWVGEEPTGARLTKAFAFSPSGRMLRRWDSELGGGEYAYDERHQVLSYGDAQVARERYNYDRATNLFDDQARTYQPGNRLGARGDTVYDWDDEGRLVRKTKRRSDVDGVDLVWTYEWDGAGQLREVVTPDGLAIDCLYDAHARRLLKRVFRLDEGGGRSLVETTRFVWNGPQLLHEIRERAGEDPIVEERTYCFDVTNAPLAQRTRRDDVAASRWVFFVDDANKVPEHLIDENGNIVGQIRRNAWGASTVEGLDTTPLRFEGQYEDSETGLFYNRYRYYDPEQGRFISQDPAGGLPDANLYRYCVNPIVGADPEGLTHFLTGGAWTPSDGSPPVKLGGIDSTIDKGSAAAMKKAGIDPTTNEGRFKNLAGPRLSDTEAKALRKIDKEAEKRKKETGVDPRKGSTVEMTGQYPPCKRCREKMDAWAKKHGAKVTYKYPAGTSPSGKRSWGAGDMTVDYSKTPPDRSWQHGSMDKSNKIT
ncbi:MAG: RHS repeat protein [Myxococcales bacterium]|nr:RHS repeat protein [Myxococcales bacterium]